MIEKALGRPIYQPAQQEKPSIQFRKSLFVVKDINQGEKFTPDNIRSIRPGDGLAPKYYDQVMDKFASRNIKRGTPVRWRLIKK